MCLQTLETRPVYTEEELQRFEVELLDREEELKRKAENLRQQQELLKERGKALEAQRKEYQQVMRSRRGHAPFSARKGDKSIVLFLLFFLLVSQAVLEMSHRQKEQQAADGQPPAGPNGELQFQPEAQKVEDEGRRSE